LQKNPKTTQERHKAYSFAVRAWSGWKLTFEYGNVESDSRSQTKAKEKKKPHTHTHTPQTLRLTPDHEIADFLLACKCICDLGQWRSVLRQFLKGKIRNKMKHGLWVGPIPLSKCCNKCGSLWQEANKENMGGAWQTLLDSVHLWTLHAGLGSIFSHLNPATKFSLQLLLAQQPSNYHLHLWLPIDVQHKIICQKRV
jgi:hypothetical protein